MIKNKGGLGRGLDALLGGEPDALETPLLNERRDAQPPADAVVEIALNDIDPNPDQPRRRFDETALEELAASIRQVGVLQPIIVRKTGRRYAIISGERRWRAARLAALDVIPAIVRDWDEVRRMEAALVENLQRDDLNPVEEASGLKGLMDQCGLTQEETARRVGKSRSAVANSLRLLTLSGAVLEFLTQGKLTAGHARALVGLPEDVQIRLARLAAEQGLNVRQMEKLAAAQSAPAAHKSAPREKDPQIRQLERMTRDVFGAKAEISGDENSGKLVIHYRTADDLQRIWDLMEFMQQNEA